MKTIKDYTTSELLLQVMKNKGMLKVKTYKEAEEKIDMVNDYFWRKMIIEELGDE